MLNETHAYQVNGENINLAFIKSQNVQAFPCGRRRSTSHSGVDDSRIPFDPEARLNTESNNRKHSGLNGFTQTYLDFWEDGADRAVFSLSGYLFTLTLEDVLDSSSKIIKTYKDLNTFCTDLANNVEATTSIFANILISNTQLFVGTYYDKGLAYYTDIIDSWVNAEAKDSSALDLRVSAENEKPDAEVDNYYFSGLAFSAKPIATLHKLEDGNTEESSFKTRDECTLKNNQKIVSLQLFDYVGGLWKVHEPAKLPNIAHGMAEDSVVVNLLEAKAAEAETITVPYDDNISKDETIDSSKISSTGMYTKYMQAESLVAETAALNGNISASNITASESISANEITAGEALYQSVDGIDMKVPVIKLVELNENGTDFWQLQLSRVGEK